MSQPKIRAAFEQRLAAFATDNGYPVAWQNTPFTEPAGAYLRASLLPANTVSATLDGAHRGYRGVFQIDVVAPIDTGPRTAEAIAEAIATEFPNALRLTQDGCTVQVTAPASLAPALQSATRYTVPVSVFYRADT